ncbi:Hypothetical protein R9X50_00284000 [Acrodontium crateriforme]|uniref:Flap structure-specific endonuclease n=1 Tax=Acrodontium crateriforme TaxID=150365 RepID=A0AAQ3M7U9_9PEZI|nr:Hypothetical protein R9X50_00284000 [Acrodontium crateriforme]
MGIHGLYGQIGPGERISLAKLSADHYSKHSRPLRLAIDIAIWLFQIQSGKGGSNPALRTFYYRLLRLLSLNIHPLFVFDGPNKPLFKRNKKVGGPGVRVANVPEFLAKQLLKQFGFPLHMAPGEAEAECALLQREGLVDAVLSEDVDTLMFGSGLTLRNWTSEGSSKTPTHVSVYRAEETESKTGLDANGMILVALMSGGDYLPDGIPGCGPTLACNAARAGFGRELCTMRTKDATALKDWKTRLDYEIRTNESKHFSRKTPSFKMPEDFPNLEVLGYYTHPCISNSDKLKKLKDSLQWDLPIDYPALRTFTAEAFDWNNLGGAKKFIRNLAPPMLVRELRLHGEADEELDEVAQQQKEAAMVAAIHGKRNHVTTDGELEFRISFTPAQLVPIDLSIEEVDDEYLILGGDPGDSDPETDPTAEADGPVSPSKKRAAKPYDPSQPEKLWILKPFLQIGCPLTVECYEASLRDPKAFLKARRQAKAALNRVGSDNAQSTTATGKTRPPKKKKQVEAHPNTMMSYARVTKATSCQPDQEKDMCNFASKQNLNERASVPVVSDVGVITGFAMPSTRIPSGLFKEPAAVRPGPPKKQSKRQADPERTPRAKRRSPVPSTPTTTHSQKSIKSFFSPSPQKTVRNTHEIVSLVTSPMDAQSLPPSRSRDMTPTPPNVRFNFIRSPEREIQPSDEPFWPGELPDTVTKRRKRKEPLSRSQTAPTCGYDGADDFDADSPPLRDVGSPFRRYSLNEEQPLTTAMDLATSVTIDLVTPSPVQETRRQQDVALSFDEPNKIARTLFSAARLSDTTAAEANVSITDELDEDSDDVLPPIMPVVKNRATAKARTASPALSRVEIPPLRRSPRENLVRKKKIILRESLDGAWKEADAEEVDLTGAGSIRKTKRAWRMSTVDVLDLTDL